MYISESESSISDSLIFISERITMITDTFEREQSQVKYRYNIGNDRFHVPVLHYKLAKILLKFAEIRKMLQTLFIPSSDTPLAMSCVQRSRVRAPDSTLTVRATTMS